MKIVSWNVRGVNDPSKCRRIKEVLSDVSPNWVGLQKTKLSKVTSPLIS